MDIKVYCLNVVHAIIECRLRKINWFRVQRSLYEYNSKEWSPKLLGLSLYICKESMTATPLPVSQESSHAWPIVSLQNKHAAWVDARAHVCQWHGKLQGSVLRGTWTNLWPLRPSEVEAHRRQRMKAELSGQDYTSRWRDSGYINQNDSCWREVRVGRHCLGDV